MKTNNSLAKWPVIWGLFVAVQPAFSQGSLTPPGPPGPIFKTLQQVEPRTPISSLPITITNSGSYYVTTNLSVTNSVDGITISADNVAVDLNGFTLTGFSILNSAVTTFTARFNLVIGNGALRDWGAGVNTAGASNSRFEKLQLFRNTANVGLQTGAGCLIIGCVAQSNLNGIVVGRGSTVKDCSALYNTGTAISLGNDCTATDCSAVNNSGAGITLGNSCIANNCKAAANSGVGLDAGLATYVLISQCVSAANSSNGISANQFCAISDCSVSGSAITGIRVAGWCQVLHNLCTYNGTATLTNEAILITGTGNRVEGNDLLQLQSRSQGQGHSQPHLEKQRPERFQL